MNDSFKADKYIKPTGEYGNGCYRAYDEKTGKSGHVNSYGVFVPDKEKKKVESSSGAVNTPLFGGGAPMPSFYDGPEVTLADTIGDGVKSTAYTLGAIGVGVGALSMLVFLMKDPQDVKGAGKKALRNVLCVFGIIFTLAFMLIANIFQLFMSSGQGSYLGLLHIVTAIVNILGIVTVVGLIRLMFGRSFLIKVDIQKIVKVIMFFRKPVVRAISFWSIMIACIVIITPKVVNWLNDLSIIWMEKYDPQLTTMKAIVIMLGMILVGLVSSVLAGLVITKILGLHKKKEK